MVWETKGDLLESGADIICHQVNFHGVMGAGVALAIRNKLLNADEFRVYQEYCEAMGHRALGSVLFSMYKPGKHVANLFSQGDWPDDAGNLTDYSALRRCLNTIEHTARKNRWSVAVPGYMGCGIAGGDWFRVRQAIMDVFETSPVELTIVYLA